MVEVVGRTEKEKALEEKVKDLERITKEMFKKKTIQTLYDIVAVLHPKTHVFEISASLNIKEVRITKPEHYDVAYQLAEAYEKHFPGEKWTLKTDYNE